MEDRHMACPSESDLIRMISGELAGDALAGADAHVEQCQTCAARADEMRGVWDLLEAWQVDARGHEVDGAVLQAVGPLLSASRMDRWVRPWRWPVPLRAAASIVLAVGVGWGTAAGTARQGGPVLAGLPESTEPVTAEAVARDMALDALSGGVPTGLVVTLINETEPEIDGETQG
jgi:hypothetical protein